MKQGKSANRKVIDRVFPKLRLRTRLLLHAVTLCCVALSFIQIMTACLPEMAGITLYVLSAVSSFYSVYYLILHLRESFQQKLMPRLMSNRHLRKIITEYRTRTIVLTIPGVFTNVVFAIFNGYLGLTGSSAWFGTMAAYYLLLSIMRIGAVQRDRRVQQIADDRIRRKEEIAVYRRNSILFIFMAIVLSGAVILLEMSAGGKQYSGLTIYAAAAYSFYKIILSTIQVIKVRKKNSPLLAIIRRIGYIDASVSILTLQTAMFASFGTGMDEGQIHLMNGLTGSGVCLIVLFMGIEGICQAKRMAPAEKSAGNSRTL